jgi:hypothetical protein
MLKESHVTRYPANSLRRWFSDEYFDLIVWVGRDEALSGFQLCYDKCKNERALTWTEEKGFIHERVDDGERNPSKNLTPILVPDGTCPTRELIERFLVNSEQIDPVLSSFVVDKLREYHGTYRA